MISPSPPDTFVRLCALLVELAAEASSPAAPSVVQARIDVYRFLVDEGWQPPDRVRALLHLNDMVLELDVEQWLESVAETPEPAEPPREIDLTPRPVSASAEPLARAEAVLVAAYTRRPQVDVAEIDEHASRLVAEAEQDLLGVTRPLDATRRLVALVQELGGDLAMAEEQGPDLLPMDLSFAAGPPVLVRAEALSLARLRLERHLPPLVEVARQALAAAER